MNMNKNTTIKDPNLLEKEDLRIRRTYKLLAQALLSLLREKSFEEIYVTDICERAMVHRTTFYKHFEDKYHLLDFCLRDLVNQFEDSNIKLHSVKSMKEYYMGLIRNSLLYMNENKELFLTGILRIGNNSVVPMISQCIKNLIYQKLIENESMGFIHKIPLDIIAHFYSGALLSCATIWLENDNKISVDEMVQHLSLLINESDYVIKSDK